MTITLTHFGWGYSKLQTLNMICTEIDDKTVRLGWGYLGWGYREN